MFAFSSGTLLAAILLMCSTTSHAQDGSSTPPNRPETAINLGTLDRVWPSSPSDGRFRCLGYNAVINFNAWWMNTQYFKFSLDGAGSDVTFQMKESPDATLWFVLRREDLSEMETYKGGDDQRFTRSDLAPGTYYVQLVTDGTMRRLPDGTNSGFVVAQGYPKGLSKVLAGTDEPRSINLGGLSSGAPIRKYGFVYAVNSRQFEFASGPNNHDCPKGPNSFDLGVREYTLQAPAGEIYVGVTVVSSQNWNNQFPFNVQRWTGGAAQWTPIDGSPIKHPGGEFKIRLGDTRAFRAVSSDAYVGFDLSIALSPNLPISAPPSVPGGVIPPTNLNDGFRPGQIIIGN